MHDWEISSDRRRSEPIVTFCTIHSRMSRGALVVEWNMAHNGISRTITFEISKLTMAPVALMERGEECGGGGGVTHTCTQRHRSGLDIAWVWRWALSRYTPDTAYHDFYPSIKTKGSISSFCTVLRLRWRILRLFSLYLRTWTTRPVVVVRILASVCISVYTFTLLHIYGYTVCTVVSLSCVLSVLVSAAKSCMRPYMCMCAHTRRRRSSMCVRPSMYRCCALRRHIWFSTLAIGNCFRASRR